MAKIGRNSPCPCGSGEKYKHCCLEKEDNVVSMTPRTRQELEKLDDQLGDFSFEYRERYLELYFDYADAHDFDPEIEGDYFTLFIVWATFNAPLVDGKTIFEIFMDKHGRSLRPQTKSVIEEWITVPGMYEIVEHVDEDQFTVESMDTGERDVIAFKDEEWLLDVGDGIIGILVPFGNNEKQFLLSFDVFDLEQMKMVFRQYEGAFSQAMKNEFPMVLYKVFMDEEDPYELIDAYEWPSKGQRAVPEYLCEMNDDIWEDESLNFATRQWHKFCEDEDPVVRKVAVFAAALEYLVMMMEGDGPTQKETAEKYGVSSASVSKRYQEMDYIMFDLFDEMIDEFGPGSPDVEDPSMLAEQQLKELQKLIQNENFSSQEEVEQFLNELSQSGKPLAPQSNTKKEQAENLIFEAHQTADSRQRIKLAEEALQLHPNSPDAFAILAEEANTLEEKNDLYFEGMIQGEAAFGPSFFENNRGYFWGLIETRPYMRAKQGYAETCAQMGDPDLAMEQYRELLDLNPMDNQGIRYLLIDALMKTGEYREAAALIDDYDEPSANMAYNRVYAEYKSNGWTRKTEQLLNTAINENPHVPEYLLGERKIPAEAPAFIGMGDENEAIDYVQAHMMLWQRERPLMRKLAEYK
ncbi:SEC-C metal-binding domain-containing protein [Natribacillus halophilus]|uniref:Tfp pilus assembly protein PilF n=1 Tax=Natribacillus halophilus TaxID=549003 RepID=A0A1G8KD29_9BACI|nr:SEC-C metal-binding domain-containing protein [Natribacillus halophilus]SDI41345.1 Tfp pilus assembly protein PilF [Natribacillus halophilus]